MNRGGAEISNPNSSLVGSIGPYEKLGHIGGGASSTVWLAQGEGHLVAIKELKRERVQNPEYRARFKRELRAAQRANGFCTARVLDADLDGPQPYIVSEYIPGDTLFEEVSKFGPLPEERVRLL